MPYSILGREEGELAGPLVVIVPHNLGKVEASRRLSQLRRAYLGRRTTSTRNCAGMMQGPERGAIAFSKTGDPQLATGRTGSS
jgi:hypothetical protein